MRAHRIDARVKIVALLAYSIGIFLVGEWWMLAVFVAVLLACMALARVHPGTVNRMLVPVYVMAAFALLFNVLADPLVPGLLRGAFLAVRMVALVAASFVLCLSTTSKELLGAFSSFIAPLGALGLPVRDVAFTLALYIRFIPVV